MPLEVFVHGALCVAYSGQCLTKRGVGGRKCQARPVRPRPAGWPYALWLDGAGATSRDRPTCSARKDLAAS